MGQQLKALFLLLHSKILVKKILARHGADVASVAADRNNSLSKVLTSPNKIYIRPDINTSLNPSQLKREQICPSTVSPILSNSPPAPISGIETLTEHLPTKTVGNDCWDRQPDTLIVMSHLI